MRLVLLAWRVLLRRGARRRLLPQAEVLLLLFWRLFALSPLSQVAWQQRQAGQVGDNEQASPDPQNPAGPTRRSPRPKLETLRRVPDGDAGEAQADDDVDNPRGVKALGMMAGNAEKDLQEHDNEDGKTHPAVRAREVRAPRLRRLDDDHNETDEDEHKGRDGDGAVHGEPLEEGPTVASDEDGGGHENEPGGDHEDHVNDDELVAPAQNPVRLALCRCPGCHGSRAA